jgi:hypothetical protein
MAGTPVGWLPEHVSPVRVGGIHSEMQRILRDRRKIGNMSSSQNVTKRTNSGKSLIIDHTPEPIVLVIFNIKARAISCFSPGKARDSAGLRNCQVLDVFTKARLFIDYHSKLVL